MTQPSMTIILISGIAIVFGAMGGALLKMLIDKKRNEAADNKATRLVEQAKVEAEKIKRDANADLRDELKQLRTEFENEARDRRRELKEQTTRLNQKEENIDRKIEKLEKRDVDLNNRSRNLDKREEQLIDKESEITELIERQRQELERVAGMSPEEAKKVLIESMAQEARVDAAKLIKQIDEEARESAEKVSKNIIALAIQRYAGDYVAEKTVSVVNLPSDEMKGRIIGREGRNIRAIEAATGVDLIIDDTPESVIVSGHNPVRREIARLSLERLITDGRIHPARIEEIVNKTTKEVEEDIRHAGKQATLDAGVHGINNELTRLIGRLKYRTSFTQNNLVHSQEVAYLCGVMAGELKLNVKKAKRAGLLHDIGKAVDHEIEGSHAHIGADIARKYGEAEDIVAAIGEHHDDNQSSIYGVLVQSADALSAARPGARREMLENYMQRLESLEKIAGDFEGVNKAYAIQAGRELRIVVESDRVNDGQALMIASDVAKRIQDELSYPGQIKVTVIRETRAVEYAK